MSEHSKSFWVQVGSAMFVILVIYFIRKFELEKKIDKTLSNAKKEASEVLKVGQFNKNTGKMNVLFNYKTKYTGNFANDLYNFTKEAEGGLSKNQSDSAYKKALAIKGFPINGFHTNMGITFETFTNNAKLLGYDPSYANFLSMSTDVWKKIFDNGYFKPFKTLSSSPLIDYTVTEWAWGSGVQGAKNLLAKFLSENGVVTIAQLQKKLNPQDLFLKMCQERLAFFESISHNDHLGAGGVDKDLKFLDGWNNRVANYFNIFSGYAK